MNLKEYLNKHESPSSLAKRTGIVSVSIINWSNGKRPIPIPRCTQLEIATGGKITRKDLRPNDWSEIWPELSGSDK